MLSAAMDQIRPAPTRAPITTAAPRRQTVGLALSMGIHMCAGFSFIQFWVSSPPRMEPPPPRPIIVELAPLPPAPPTPKADPAPDRVKETAKVETSPSPPPLPLHESIAPNRPVISLPIRVEHGTRPQAMPPADAPPPPSTDRKGVETFEGRLLARIEQFRRYPDEALRRRQQGVVQIRFRMNRDGKVLEAAVSGSSGSSALDREAIATIRRAQPFPKIPDDRPDEIAVSVPVEFFLS